MRLVAGLALAALAVGCEGGNPAAAPPTTPPVEIPTLTWTERSDWINVKSHGAKGDGKTDDTAAIQGSLELLASCYAGNDTSRSPPPANVSGWVVYFPPGTYLVKKSLHVRHCIGMTIVGSGAASTLKWAGPHNGSMFVSNGTTFTSVNGLVWDGSGVAQFGFDYNSTGTDTLFETRQLHRNELFRGFTGAGIAVGVYNGPPGDDGYQKLRHKKESSEGMFQNCIFENNFKGIALENFNDYDFGIDACTFRDNGWGVFAAVHRDSNWDVHSCRFERSTISDLGIAAEASNARQIVSVGSRQFLSTVNWPGPPGATPVGSGGGPYHAALHIHDCRIVNWTGPTAITFGLRGPLTVTNTEFVGGPANATLLTMKQALDINMSGIVLEGGNLRDGVPVNFSTPGFSASDPNTVSYSIAGGALSSTPAINPDTQFTEATGKWAVVPSTVFDCSLAPFLANTSNDQRCDDRADAIQSCINAAAKKGGAAGLATAYLPGGTWSVCKSLTLPAGRNYSLSGAGEGTRIAFEPAFWPTPADPDPFVQPTALEVDPSCVGVRVEAMTIARYRMHPDQDNSYTVRVNATGSPTHRPPLSLHLDWLFGDETYNGSTHGIHLLGLGAGDVVTGGYLDHPMELVDSANATVLVDFLTGGRVTISGNANRPRSGFFGIKLFAGLAIDYDVILIGPQDLVFGYAYIESVSHHLLLQGPPPSPPPPPPPGPPCGGSRRVRAAHPITAHGTTRRGNRAAASRPARRFGTKSSAPRASARGTERRAATPPRRPSTQVGWLFEGSRSMRFRAWGRPGASR